MTKFLWSELNASRPHCAAKRPRHEPRHEKPAVRSTKCAGKVLIGRPQATIMLGSTSSKDLNEATAKSDCKDLGPKSMCAEDPAEFAYGGAISAKSCRS